MPRLLAAPSSRADWLFGLIVIGESALSFAAKARLGVGTPKQAATALALGVLGGGAVSFTASAWPVRPVQGLWQPVPWQTWHSNMFLAMVSAFGAGWCRLASIRSTAIALTGMKPQIIPFSVPIRWLPSNGKRYWTRCARQPPSFRATVRLICSSLSPSVGGGG